MRFSDIYRQLDETRAAHETAITLIEQIVSDIDRASDQLRRLATNAVQPTGPDGQMTAPDLMWRECEHRLGAQLNAARTALVREVVDYAQTLEAYHRASRTPLRPVH